MTEEAEELVHLLRKSRGGEQIACYGAAAGIKDAVQHTEDPARVTCSTCQS